MLPADRQIAVYCYTGHTGQVAATILGTLGYNVSNVKYGMMGWTEDDAVLATARFGPDVQRDYRLETSAAATSGAASEEPAPTQLPASGATNSASWLVWLAGGLGVLLSGLALRRRFVG